MSVCCALFIKIDTNCAGLKTTLNRTWKTKSRAVPSNTGGQKVGQNASAFFLTLLSHMSSTLDHELYVNRLHIRGSGPTRASSFGSWVHSYSL
jgi:hypothetical protein